MSALGQLNAYLQQLERRLRITTVTTGVAVLGTTALAATFILVLVTNAFAFSPASVAVARVVLFLAVAFALGFGFLLPLVGVNRRRAARRAEQAFPEFEQRLLTLTEARRPEGTEPFLELLADDALETARYAEPRHVITAGRILGFAGAAAATLAALLWLTVAGPGFIGYGSSLLWAGTPPGENRPFYDIRVQPGNQRVRRGGDQLVTAQLVGFQAGKVRLFARYESASKWEEVLMEPEPGASGYEFLFAGVPESVDYYVQAGAVRSQRYRLTVIDLPKVQRIQVRYHFPAWLGKEDAVEDADR